MSRLVLWDIDHTLVDAGGVAEEVFADAFAAVLGWAPGRLVPMGGRTDPEIALDVLALHGIGDGERHLDAFSAALADALARKEQLVRQQGRALPGARDALLALGQVDGVVQSVLTGNIVANAVVKLAAFGLDGLLDLEIGAFGSDDRRRPSLVAVARAKAQAAYGDGFAGGSTVLIGDTPFDVAAARFGSARSVAVATGDYGMEELRASGADVVLGDLRDTGAVLAAVLGTDG